MIKLTLFSNEQLSFYINPDHIISMIWMVNSELTKVVLTDASRLEIVETPEQIMELINGSD